MQRRTLLRRSAALGAIALAGCNSDGDGAETPPPDAVTEFGEWEVTTTNAGCLDGNQGSASVAFQESPLSVEVSGTIRAANPCYEIDFQSIKYDTDDGLLEVTFGTNNSQSGAGCEDCIGGIEYEATFNLKGSLPGTVLVKHASGNTEKEIARVSQ